MKIFFFIVLLNSFIVAQNNLLPEATVAVVNGTAISEEDLNREVTKELPRAYFHANIDDKKLDKLKKKALKSLIERTIFYKYALSKNITVDNSRVENVIKKLRKTYDSDASFKNALKRSDFTINSLKKSLQKDDVLYQLYKKEIEVIISDKELKEYYEKNLFKFKEPEKIKVSIIYVRTDPTDPKGKQKAKKRIELAAAELKKGENFPFVAQSYSDDPSRVMGGSLGYLHRGRLNPTIEDKAFSMDSNSTSDIIEKDVGYYIIRVDDRKKQNQLAFKDIKDGLKSDLKKKKEDKRKAALLEKLMKTAVIIK